MTTGFVGSGLSVQVGFTSNVWATSVTWTDITKYVIGPIQISIGRQHELQQVNPSTATMVLENQVGGANGRFSPWNTSSPYYNSGTGLTPGHPVRIQQTISATTYNVYYGYTQSFIPTYGQSRSTVTLNCYDGMALLNLAYMDQNLYDPQVLADGATAYWECQDPVGSMTFADATGNGNVAGAIGAIAFGTSGGALQAIGDQCAQLSGGGYLSSGIAPAAVSHVMFEGWRNTTTANQTLMSWAVGQTGGNIFGVSLCLSGSGLPVLAGGALNAPVPTGFVLAGSTTPTIDGNWHHYVVEVPSTDATGTYTLWVDGVLIGSGSNSAYNWDQVTAHDYMACGYWSENNAGGLGLIEQIPAFTGKMDRDAYYQTPLSSAQIAKHYALGSAGFVTQDSGARTATVLENLAGVPSGLVNCDIGVVQVQGATSALNQTSVASYLQQVTNTERGITYQDGLGVLQFKNRNHVYTNANSVNSQVTFTYDGTGSYYYSAGLVPGEDDTDLWNDINVSRQGGIIQNASDATSIAAYGRRSLTGYTSLLFAEDSDAYDLASGLLYQYKKPAARVRSIKTSTLSNGMTGLAKVLALNLLDRVTVVWKPIDSSTVAFNQQSLVEQVTHTITPGQWDTALAVTPIGTEVFALWGSGLWNTALWGF